ncbi:aminoglycoside phosphotransferase family protein [Solwaraspora sp. WMMD791]|uniref:aminoglycoside phosphotransferase family protein n=1 Tax=Solwaraspora sp. WMMD791 TaxID=3016086 RepID=UPI00249A8D0D|nr:aminoglycoside phosphotransferase family protein [Solwaraspora sp. WMMD791]WFE27882.1 aminoglycoside phosphotransferase family protein [Solwaraspora sp. WMMD791]
MAERDFARARFMPSGSRYDVGGSGLAVPAELAASHATYFGEAGRAWIAALPHLAAATMDRWGLRPDGPASCGAIALVLPVVQADGSPAMLKLQPIDEETVGEPVALRAWGGDGAVRLLRHDAHSGTMLLERLDADRTLAVVPDDLTALRILSQLLARLTSVAAPPAVRRLADVAAGMLDRVPQALVRLPAADHPLIRRCAAAVQELLPEAGDRLLHWDLHYDNVLASRTDSSGFGSAASDSREPWLAIDPKPLAGDPCFELLPALHNRWDDVVATGDVPRAVRRRFDLTTEILGVDRERSVSWTLGRVLQNLLWESEAGGQAWHSAPDRAIARTLLRER